MTPEYAIGSPATTTRQGLSPIILRYLPSCCLRLAWLPHSEHHAAKTSASRLVLPDINALWTSPPPPWTVVKSLSNCSTAEQKYPRSARPSTVLLLFSPTLRRLPTPSAGSLTPWACHPKVVRWQSGELSPYNRYPQCPSGHLRKLPWRRVQRDGASTSLKTRRRPRRQRTISALMPLMLLPVRPDLHDCACSPATSKT